MKQDTYISKMEELERWFEMNNTGTEGRPYFTLYRGWNAKPDCIIYRNTEITEPEKAWEQLEEVISAHAESGGSFRVFITNKPGFNVGMTTLLCLPNPNPMAMNAISGTAGGVGMWGIYGDPKTMIEAEVTRRQELYELKREMEDLRAEKDSKIGAIDRFFENLVERPEMYQLVQHLGMRLLSSMPAGQAPQPPMPAAVAGTPVSDHEGFDYERVEPALYRLSTVFPDTETTLEKLAAWAAANPEMAASLFQNLPA